MAERCARGLVLFALLLAAAPAQAAFEVDAAETKRALKQARKAFPHAPAVVLRQHRDYRCDLAGTAGFRCQTTVERSVLVRGAGSAQLRQLTHRLVGRDRVLEAETLTRSARGREARTDKEALSYAAAGFDARSGRPLRLLSLPASGVTPGSVVHHRLVIEHETPVMSDHALLAAPYPILAYDYAVTMPAGVQVGLKIWNNAHGVTKEAGKSETRWRLSVESLPALRTQSHARPAADSRPFWVMVVTDWRARALPHNVSELPVGLRSWEDAARWYEALVEERWETLTRDAEALEKPDEVEALRWAYDYVRAELQTREDEPYALRPLAVVIASGEANAAEKAVLLRYLLEREGITAHLAATRAPERGPWPQELPTPLLLSDLLVYIPPEGEVGAGQWLDPTSLHCEPGQLPRRMLLRRALVLEANRRNAFSPLEVRVRKSQPQGEPCVASTLVERFVGDLRKDGGLVGEIEVEGRGPETERIRRGMRDKGAGWLTGHLGVHLGRTLASQMELRAARGEVGNRPGEAKGIAGFVMTRWGVQAHDALLLPLSILRGPLDRQAWLAERSVDLRLRHGQHFERSLKLRLGRDFELVGVPEPRVVTGLAGRYQLEVNQQPGELVITRKLTIEAGDYPASRYAEFLKLLTDAEADLLRLIEVKVRR